MTDQRRLAQGSDYDDHRSLIYDTIRKFHVRYGVDSQDLLSESNELFLKAHRTYRSEEGTLFSTWLRCVLWHGFLSFLRRRAQEARRRRELLPNTPDRKHSSFRLEDLLAELSKDARTVVRLVLDPPDEVQRAVAVRGAPTPTRLRLAVRRFLRKVGWTQRRILECTGEIRRVLQS